MAAAKKNPGWPGLFLMAAVFCAILSLTAQRMEGPGLYVTLCQWAVPAFFMVYGMNALGEGKLALGSVFLNMVLPTFCLLVVWSAVYAIVSHLLGGGGVSLFGVWNALKAAALGDTYIHLWILYPLLGLYLVHPVLQRFAGSASRGEVCYFLMLCFVVASLLPVWTAFFPDSVIAVLLERLQIHLVLGWTGYYVAGWYFFHYTISRMSEFIVYGLGILGLMLTVTGDALFGGGSLWQGYTAPGVALTSVALCVLFRYVLGVSEERARRQTAYRLGSCAMGIYLAHQLWVLLFDWLGVSALPIPAVLGVVVFTLIYMLASIPVAWLAGKIPGLGRRL